MTTTTEATTGALAEYNATAAALADLRQRFDGVVWDLKTTKGNDEARAARKELVTLRTSLEAKRKELKAPALERSRLIDSEAARITGEIVALEKPIDEQIKADESRREAERKARIEAEALRVNAITERIAGIVALGNLPAGVKAADVQRGIVHALALNLTATDFAELLPAAERARDEVIAKLKILHAAAVAHEAEQARIEAERAELARMRAEQEAAARQLAAERARIDAEQQAESDRIAAIEAEQRRAAQQLADDMAEFQQMKAEAAAAEAQRLADQQQAEQRAAAQKLADERAAFERAQAEGRAAAAAAEAATQAQQAILLAAAAPHPAPTQATLLADAEPSPSSADKPPTLKLGTICERLSFTVSADFMVTLGYSPKVEKGARLFHEADFVAICRAISAHVLAVAKEHERVTS